MKKKQKILISKHILVPKHIKISKKEKQELFDKYNLNVENLPKILKTDAAIASLDAQPGDVIKIIRKSPTAGEAIFYRGVTNV